jgi:hypothetical protein
MLMTAARAAIAPCGTRAPMPEPREKEIDITVYFKQASIQNAMP